jgi:hypothetical protein
VGKLFRAFVYSLILQFAHAKNELRKANRFVTLILGLWRRWERERVPEFVGGERRLDSFYATFS